MIIQYLNLMLQLIFLGHDNRYLVILFLGVVTTPKLDTDRWYYIEMSWHPDHGLKFFVDNQLVGEAPSCYGPPSLASDMSHFYIGQANIGDVPRGGQSGSGHPAFYQPSF